MNFSLPDYLSDLNFFVRTAVLLTLAAGLWLALRRTEFSRGARLATWLTITAALIGWYALAWRLGQANVFLQTPNDVVPPIPFAILSPIAAGLFLLMRSQRVAAVIDAVPQSWLTGVQVYRALGAMFLMLWAQGGMPGEFALPAGIGDVIVGLTAPVVAWLNVTRSPAAHFATWAWNIFGVADLAVAVGTGFLSSPSSYQMLAFDNPNLLVTAYPIVMVPVFLVPVSIILHVLSLWKLHRSAARTASFAGAATG